MGRIIDHYIHLGLDWHENRAEAFRTEGCTFCVVPLRVRRLVDDDGLLHVIYEDVAWAGQIIDGPGGEVITAQRMLESEEPLDTLLELASIRSAIETREWAREQGAEVSP